MLRDVKAATVFFLWELFSGNGIDFHGLDRLYYSEMVLIYRERAELYRKKSVRRLQKSFQTFLVNHHM